MHLGMLSRGQCCHLHNSYLHSLYTPDLELACHHWIYLAGWMLIELYPSSPLWFPSSYQWHRYLKQYTVLLSDMSQDCQMAPRHKWSSPTTFSLMKPWHSIFKVASCKTYTTLTIQYTALNPNILWTSHHIIGLTSASIVLWHWTFYIFHQLHQSYCQDFLIQTWPFSPSTNCYIHFISWYSTLFFLTLVPLHHPSLFSDNKRPLLKHILIKSFWFPVNLYNHHINKQGHVLFSDHPPLIPIS